MKICVLTFVLHCLLMPLTALAWEARVVDVADGDTVTVEPVKGGERIKVRLHGIDAPETRQPYGHAAKGFVSNATLYKIVDIKEAQQGKDRYGRTVAVVVIPNVGILQEMLLVNGLAWVYLQYCKNCAAWMALQNQAQGQRRGLWADKNPIPPWAWRKHSR
jgi:endonuclease YncB( thermonuclease family)